MGSGASKSEASNLRYGTTTITPTVAANGNSLSSSTVVDSRLPFSHFRELFTMKNYWKTVRRNDVECSKLMFFKYLNTNFATKLRYDKLKSVEISSHDCGITEFDTIALAYLKVFDDVINCVEDSPSDATTACSRLFAVGKLHRAKVPGLKLDDFQLLETPFLYMIQEILQDRFNDKAENLFRKFFQFCLKYILEGFNS